MPTYTDTHAHLDAFETDEGGIPALLERARTANVTQIIAIGGDLPRNRFAIQAAQAHTATVRAAVGYDRDCATGQWSERLLRDQLVRAKEDGIVAIGEIGLDFHYHPETATEQEALFDAMLAMAREFTLPVVVHSRNAEARTLEMLKAHVAAWPGPADRMGVLHCFTGDRAFAEPLVDTGLYISFSGIASFRNAASIRESIPCVPEDRLLIETDSPYLAPVPHRGKRNEPAYVPDVAAVLAQELDRPCEDIAALTTANAQRLFGLD